MLSVPGGAGTEERVVLVDPADRPVGTLEKLQAHREGRLHRAFSVFLFDGGGSMLLQRRALDKYHSGGLWSNSCCGHPRPAEETATAARRRLREEMGVDCGLSHAFSFVYRADLGHGLCEHELDHVYIGRVDRERLHPAPDPVEVAEWGWREAASLRLAVAFQPHHFTVWFRIVLERVLAEVAREGAVRARRATPAAGP